VQSLLVVAVNNITFKPILFSTLTLRDSKTPTRYSLVNLSHMAVSPFQHCSRRSPIVCTFLRVEIDEVGIERDYNKSKSAPSITARHGKYLNFLDIIKTKHVLAGPASRSIECPSRRLIFWMSRLACSLSFEPLILMYDS
jgi:hypothetical protein